MNVSLRMSFSHRMNVFLRKNVSLRNLTASRRSSCDLNSLRMTACCRRSSFLRMTVSQNSFRTKVCLRMNVSLRMSFSLRMNASIHSLPACHRSCCDLSVLRMTVCCRRFFFLHKTVCHRMNVSHHNSCLNHFCRNPYGLQSCGHSRLFCCLPLFSCLSA